MVICHFWLSIVKDNKNWLLVSKNRLLGPTGKVFLARGKGNVGPRWATSQRAQSQQVIVSLLHQNFSGLPVIS
jgi:hypothetical protein